jgi:ABC-2 type transport system ATP-binding protein
MNAVLATPAAAAPLACEHIVKRYDGHTVLSDVTLSIPRGAVLGLIGRNGAGKSTLIRILIGLQEADAGSASILGEPSLELTDRSKTRLGYVPQQPDALSWMRVGDMLEFVGRLYPNWDPAFVRRALERWQLPLRQPLGKLSPGERQRVAIIRALAVNPELLVLDEPAAALDPVARRELLREIAVRAGEMGTTVLFSTHIVPDLERVASHVAFLHDTRVVLSTPLDELNERHARLIVPPVHAKDLPQRLIGELSRRRRPDGGLTLVIVRDNRTALAVEQLPGVRADVLPLEDLFIEVAG